MSSKFDEFNQNVAVLRNALPLTAIKGHEQLVGAILSGYQQLSNRELTNLKALDGLGEKTLDNLDNHAISALNKIIESNLVQITAFRLLGIILTADADASLDSTLLDDFYARALIFFCD